MQPYLALQQGRRPQVQRRMTLSGRRAVAQHARLARTPAHADSASHTLSTAEPSSPSRCDQMTAHGGKTLSGGNKFPCFKLHVTKTDSVDRAEERRHGATVRRTAPVYAFSSMQSTDVRQPFSRNTASEEQQHLALAGGWQREHRSVDSPPSMPRRRAATRHGKGLGAANDARSR